MKRFVKITRGLAAGFALFAMTAQQATAQFVAVNNYQAPPAAAVPAYGAPPTAVYGAQPAATYATPPATAQAVPPAPAYATPAPAGYAAQQAPAYGVPPTATYAAPPNYHFPRVAQTATLPAPAEAIKAVAPATPQQAAPATQPAYATPATNYSQPVTTAPATMSSTYSQPSTYSQAPVAQSTYSGVPTAGCATGNCGGTSYAAPASMGYDYQAAGCATGGCDTGGCYTGADCAPACDVGCAAPAPRRQWFAGLYGLYMSRAGDQSKRMVAYMTDTAGWAPPTPDYYPTTADPTLFSDAAGQDDLLGAEFRFGSTFGCDSCGCSQPFAWEIGYWALDDDSSSATLLYPGTVSLANTQRLYQNTSYGPLNVDLDGAGATWADRTFYGDDGMPASRDLDANDVRIVGVRVRQRFQAQNLELNFWRFGMPAAAPSCGLGACGAGACGTSSCGVGSSCGTGSCGVGSCGPTACAPCAAPCRPPRRFFINGLVGMRYLRVDDDFGLDQQFTLVDTDPTSGTYGDPPAGWPTAYESFPIDDNSVIFSDYEADNELIGFQLGCSMNWLVGCRWNLFADTNMGIYGNNAEVYKRVYGGGDSYVTFANGGGAAAVRGSETNVSFVGELRAGVGYQITCNCRLTAAYRFIGIGGVALGAEEYQNTVWTNAETASHIDTNNSIILHGLQTGVECKF